MKIEGSGKALQFVQCQEGHLEEYLVELVEFETTATLDVLTGGWTHTIGVDLTPGETYNVKVTSISHGKQSDSVTLTGSTTPAAPIVGQKTLDKNSIEFQLSYQGSVEVIALNNSIYQLR